MFEDGSSVISFHNSYAVLVSPSQVHIKNIFLKWEVYDWYLESAPKSRIDSRDGILILKMPYFSHRSLKMVKEKTH